MPHILIIGGGPAGLRAAEVASMAGVEVTLLDQKRSIGRKFLVAGKGGLNLTHSEDLATFATRYSGPDQPRHFWQETLELFDNKAIRAWAAKLDVGTFVQKSGRVYPKALKAAPLLRRWLERLRNQGVAFRTSHRLVCLSRNEATFESPEGEVIIRADAIILAMGGGSWPHTGSDGAWVPILEKSGIKVSPLIPANCGWEVHWSTELANRIEGQAIKNIRVSVGSEVFLGELMLTRYGLEGGPMYALGPALRAMEKPEITIDFKPTFEEAKLVAKMESAKRNFLAESEWRWKLNEAMRLILDCFHGPFDSAEALASHTKSCRIPLISARPTAEAISSAGGVAWSAVDDKLMLRDLPGVFVAGEMLDWEAPTGGYLLQGCFATGTLVAQSTLDFLGIYSH